MQHLCLQWYARCAKVGASPHVLLPTLQAICLCDLPSGCDSRRTFYCFRQSCSNVSFVFIGPSPAFCLSISTFVFSFYFLLQLSLCRNYIQIRLERVEGPLHVRDAVIAEFVSCSVLPSLRHQQSNISRFNISCKFYQGCWLIP